MDDHVDKLDVSIPVTDCGGWLWQRGSEVMLCGTLSRFWSLDDDGCYLLTLSPSMDSPPAPASALPLHLDAVLTVSPRNDHEVFDDDLTECLVTCTVQIDTCHKTWQRLSLTARDAFVNNFVLQLLQLRDSITLSRYELDSSRWLTAPAIAARPHSGGLGSRQVPPSPATLARMGSDVSVGVITTQPGGPTSHAPPRGGPKMPPAAPMGTSAGKHVARQSQRDDYSEGRHRSSTSSSRHGAMISRSHKVNAEAAGIRSQIATKEFELARLEKMVRKHGSGHSGQAGPAISSQPSQVVIRPDPRVMQQIQDLLLELKELKIQYFRLTGVDYAQTGRQKKAPEPRPPRDREKVPRTATLSPIQSATEKRNRASPVPMEHPTSIARASLPATPAARSLIERQPSSASSLSTPPGLASTSPGSLAVGPAETVAPSGPETKPLGSSGNSTPPSRLAQLPCPPHWSGSYDRALTATTTAM